MKYVQQLRYKPLMFLLLSLLLIATAKAGDSNDLLGLPAGSFFEVDQHRMHIECAGTSDITVVVDSGIGGSSIEWSLVRDELDDDTRFCSYDRSGYGWSDPGSSERTTETITNELRELLEISGQKPPYILIGHSFGGFTARYFSYHYPSEVSGIILVDSSHPDQAVLMNKLTTGSNKRTNGMNPLQFPHENFIKKLPAERRLQAGFLNSRRKAIFAQMDEIKYFQTSAEQVKAATPLPNIPITVITHGNKIWPETADGKNMEIIWKELQESLTKLTNKGRHVIAKQSGHNIHIDQPQLIAQSIQEMILLNRAQPQFKQPK